MAVDETEGLQCAAFTAAMVVLAKPWTGLLIRALGAGPRRFSELGPSVGPIGDRMLSLRLRELEGYGLVHREVLPGPPVRVEYALTELGRGFSEVAKAVSRWGHALLAARDKRASTPAVTARPSRGVSASRPRVRRAVKASLPRR
jgi:DNA-binding HxlR family transcriptional regulator